MNARIPVSSDVQLAVNAEIRGGRPVLALSNSLAADMTMWNELVRLVSDEMDVIRYDARGHGQSDTGTGSLSIETLGRDVIAILDHFKIEKSYLCGLSLGGLTAQWLGVNFPARFSGIMLANTAFSFPPASMWTDRARLAREQGLAPLLEATLDRWLTKSFQQNNPGRSAEVSGMISGTPGEGYARCCEVLAQTDLSAAVSGIMIPVRVICGEHDKSTTPERGSELAAKIPQADVVVLDAAHISSIEAADDFANAVKEFVGAVERDNWPIRV